MIDDKLLDEITAQAEASPRLRMNHNIHRSLQSPCQRLINVLLPGTELPVHRHCHTDETYILLRGKLAVIFYDNDRQLVSRVLLDPAAGNYGVNIPAGTWHTIEVLTPSAIFEVKDGPYTPLAPDDILP